MGKKKFYVGNYGFDILADYEISMADATSISFVVEKPSGATVTWSPVTIFENNSLRYVVEDGDLDEAGTYEIQPFATVPTTEGTTVVGGTNIIFMKVNPAKVAD